eukprot:CAMPEP_0204618668 /NCGR_PEP_ID=MMETSP0717-20131115/5244_1 /ASSEMBLY_ACC=CAM_ASM_000666 /TAXON_ID=230516 /ORGANISM="Chaetoceros curvisetus" /LENGTH=266 /DNA_ID=CAMNT_0051632457 /DNA_START=10 /DNA_END=810 /DNA_ORIENTATION=+
MSVIMQSPPRSEYKYNHHNTTVDVDSDSNGNDMSDALSPFSSPPSSNISWEATRDAMNKLIAHCTNTNTNTSTDTTMSIIDEMTEAISPSSLQRQQDTIIHNTQTILSHIQSKLQSTQSQYTQEQNTIQSTRQYIHDLELEMNDISTTNEDLVQEEIQLTQHIQQYTTLANECVNVQQEVEVQQKEQVYRLQTQISLHALVSGIKWDFDTDLDCIAGEIEVNRKNSSSRSRSSNGHGNVYTKRFELDRRDYSSFDLANLLWDMMEA